MHCVQCVALCSVKQMNFIETFISTQANFSECYSNSTTVPLRLFDSMCLDIRVVIS